MTKSATPPQADQELGAQPAWRPALRVAGIYAAAGIVWILLSDHVVDWISRDPRTATGLQTAKGWFFVVATASLLYLLLHRQFTLIRRATTELTRSRDSLRTLIDTVPAAIVDLDREGKVVSLWNSAAERILGWNRDEVLGQHSPLVPPDKEAEFRALWDRTLSGEIVSDASIQRVDKSGRVKALSLSTTPIRDRNGATLLLGVALDITDRKRAEESLRNSLEFKRLIIESSAEGILVLDTNRRLTLWNPAMERLTALNAVMVLGRRLDELPGFPAGLVLLENAEAAFQGQTRVLSHYEFSLADGSRCAVAATFAAIGDARGNIMGVLGTLHDLKMRNLPNEAAPQAPNHSKA